MAPELALHGQLSGKADVFSFGVLALEVVSGRTNTDINLIGTNMQHLLAWVLPHFTCFSLNVAQYTYYSLYLLYFMRSCILELKASIWFFN
jgi:hypothetical protein